MKSKTLKSQCRFAAKTATADTSTLVCCEVCSLIRSDDKPQCSCGAPPEKTRPLKVVH